MPRESFAPVFFWGQFLRDSEFKPAAPDQAKLRESKRIKDLFAKKPDTRALDKVNKESYLTVITYLKPPSRLALRSEKETFAAKAAPESLSFKRKEPTIILHPALPYNFNLYFNDRQTAHVELAFNVESTPTRSSLVVKRKISSGNLEVDLLSMRHIGHYLFIQQAKFTPNTWQTVKIDLSAQND